MSHRPDAVSRAFSGHKFGREPTGLDGPIFRLISVGNSREFSCKCNDLRVPREAIFHPADREISKLSLYKQ